MFDGNFVNLYFEICLACWAISIVVSILMLIIPPFRRKFVRFWFRFGTKIGEDMIPEIERVLTPQSETRKVQPLVKEDEDEYLDENELYNKKVEEFEKCLKEMEELCDK